MNSNSSSNKQNSIKRSSPTKTIQKLKSKFNLRKNNIFVKNSLGITPLELDCGSSIRLENDSSIIIMFDDDSSIIKIEQAPKIYNLTVLFWKTLYELETFHVILELKDHKTVKSGLEMCEILNNSLIEVESIRKSGMDNYQLEFNGKKLEEIEKIDLKKYQFTMFQLVLKF